MRERVGKRRSGLTVRLPPLIPMPRWDTGSRRRLSPTKRHSTSRKAGGTRSEGWYSRPRHFAAACYLALKSPSMHRGDRTRPPRPIPFRYGVKNFLRRTGRTAVGEKSADRKWRTLTTYFYQVTVEKFWTFCKLRTETAIITAVIIVQFIYKKV